MRVCLELSIKVETFLSLFFRQPDPDAPHGPPDAHHGPADAHHGPPNADEVADGGGQHDVAAVIGPIGPQLFGAAPFPGYRSFSLQVS